MCATPRSPNTRGSIDSLRLNTMFGFCLYEINALMVTSTGASSRVCGEGKVEVGTVRDGAAATPGRS